MKLGAAKAAGLHTDQGPPLSIPVSFFVLAPLSLLAVGTLLSMQPSTTSRWTSQLLAATHVGTLGLLGSVMLGALYQMLPVLAGAPVPGARTGHGVWLLWVIGTCALVRALLVPSRWGFTVAMLGLGGALALFIPPVAVALARAPHRSENGHRVEVHGMRAAVFALAFVALYGLKMAWGWAHMALPADRVSLVAGHIVAGVLGWVGLLLAAVSTQIIPMFYLTEPMPRRASLLSLVIAVCSIVAAASAPMLGATAREVVFLAAPAALILWVLHPALTLRLLATRRRKRADMSVRFWQIGLGCAPLLVFIAIAGLLEEHPRWPLLFGWVTIFGWAGLIMHGMLTRILPFLVWFHRYAPRAGLERVPPMRRLFPASRARPALVLHTSGVAVGAVALGFGLPWMLRVAGISLFGAGLVLAYAMFRMLHVNSHSD